jgi:hypothetical protein
MRKLKSAGINVWSKKLGRFTPILGGIGVNPAENPAPEVECSILLL